ncbi:MAG: glycine betaine ABC transporter substrate-binding protein [Spirochaetaceae bacterium]|nr:glycine betaine ABC transporter substrate-binding protein [Spirochaetaceae bacterium]
MSNRRKVIGIAAIGLLLAVGVLFVSCNQTEDAEQQKTARLAYVNWAEGVAYTHVAQVVLEEKMGYDVTITAADVAPAYTSVAEGDNDVLMECWPVLQKDYIEKYGENIYDIGLVYEGTQVGLVVPQYMIEDGVKSVSDLKKPEVVKKLRGVITGIDSGAGLMNQIENEVIPEYGLDEAGLKLMASSGPAMTAALKKAIESNNYIVVVGWQPHWKFGVWDLAFLEQDKKTFWKEGIINMYGHKGLKEEKPELEQFLKNFYFTDEEMGDLLVAYKNSDDPYTMAQKWVEEHPSVWKNWIPK